MNWLYIIMIYHSYLRASISWLGLDLAKTIDDCFLLTRLNDQRRPFAGRKFSRCGWWCFWWSPGISYTVVYRQVDGTGLVDIYRGKNKEKNITTLKDRSADPSAARQWRAPCCPWFSRRASHRAALGRGWSRRRSSELLRLLLKKNESKRTLERAIKVFKNICIWNEASFDNDVFECAKGLESF